MYNSKYYTPRTKSSRTIVSICITIIIVVGGTLLICNALGKDKREEISRAEVIERTSKLLKEVRGLEIKKAPSYSDRGVCHSTYIMKYSYMKTSWGKENYGGCLLVDIATKACPDARDNITDYQSPCQ